MVNWNHGDMMNYEARQNAAKGDSSDFDHGKDCGQARESDLHDLISSHLRSKRLFFVHSRTDKRATNTVGTPDYIIALPKGKTIWLEIKRKGQKLRPEQRAIKLILELAEHYYRIAYSYEDFLTVINDKVTGG